MDWVRQWDSKSWKGRRKGEKFASPAAAESPMQEEGEEKQRVWVDDPVMD